MGEARRLVEAAAGPDPEAGFAAVVALRGLAEVLEELQVDNARARGWSWRDIARRLGVTKQAVHYKHALPSRATVSGMWDRLSPEAREVMSLALTESEQLGHGYLGDEHVLLGLLRGAGQPGVVPAAGARPGSCQRPRRAAAAFRGRADAPFARR